MIDSSTSGNPDPLGRIDLGRLSPIDRLLVELLQRDRDFQVSALPLLSQWWGRQRGIQSLTRVLTDHGVLHESSERQLHTVQRGYVQLDGADSLFTADGRQILVDLIATPVPVPVESPAEATLPTGSSDERTLSTSLPDQSELQPGQSIGSYRLLSRIGRGPNGPVFEAEDTNLGRRVAIKFLPGGSAREPGRVDRFLDLARQLARFGHPNCITLLAAGRYADTAFLVTPMMSGSALDQLLARGPLSPNEATRLCIGTARCVAAAHALGLSHGNLKPGNLLIRDDGEAVVCDFASGAATVALADDLRGLGLTYAWLLTGRQVHSADEIRPNEAPTPCRQVIDGLCASPSQFRNLSEAADALESLRELLSGVETARLPETPPPVVSDDTFSRIPPARPPRPPKADPQTLEVGRVLGRCLLTEKIGQGSSGIVYRALHQTLNIPVAVKVLTIDRADEDDVRRQLRIEARLLASLNHPHIVRVWDVDDAAELPYLVLEFVEGLSLTELTQQSGRLRLDRATKIVGQVAAALGAAAQAGIVHRDVKPANILLTRDGTAKLADLGLATIVRGRHHPAMEAGGTDGGLAGTAAYMAPEQAVNSNQVDHRSDIYSLGATFFQVLTGQLPFPGKSRWELILKHAKELPPPPHELAPELPRVVTDVVYRMMAKDPDDRYATYDELILDLERLHALAATPGSRPAGSAEATTRVSIWKSLFRLAGGSSSEDAR